MWAINSTLGEVWSTSMQHYAFTPTYKAKNTRLAQYDNDIKIIWKSKMSRKWNEMQIKCKIKLVANEMQWSYEK